MPIAPNTKFDHYQILAPLGKGGMGEVFRARDTRLNRDVALKVLPASFATDTDRVQRFEQEALATSSLNHPNILTVHDFGVHDGNPFIVMELLEGTELREPITHGALPVRKAIEYAQQIVAGLAAAHEKGIVHRDLKPENLFVTKDGRVKILDFGLAKLTEARQGDGAMGRRGEEESTLALSPHRPVAHSPHTIPGTVMGTVAYMSPEQVRGEVVDHRSDIFSFGLILFEMLRGDRAFQRETMAETMTAILKDDPPELSETNTKISPQLERLVRRCLEKKPERRFQTASDLGFALESSTGSAGFQPASASEASPSAARKMRAHPAWFVAALLLLAALPFVIAYFRRAPAESRATYTYLPWPEKTYIDLGALAISPDGRRIAFTAIADGTRYIWLYSLDKPEPIRLAGTEGGTHPFWSPDGRQIGFFSFGKLKKIEAIGGTSETLCDATIGVGGTWNNAGAILFSPLQQGGGIYRVSDKGGTATPVTSLDATRLETNHNFPRFLPDGRHFVVFVRSAQPGNTGIYLGAIDQPQLSFLLRSDTNAEYSDAGFLVFMRGRKVLAQQFDAEKLALSGEPLTLAEQGYFSFSDFYTPLTVFGNRLLIYRSAGNPDTELAWFDRSGKRLSVIGVSGEYRMLNLSPDNRQILLERLDQQQLSTDLWSFDTARETLTRITDNPASEVYSYWSPDGRHIAFTANWGGAFAIWQKGVNGGDGKEEPLFKGEPRITALSDWSGDGKFLVYWKPGEQTSNDIWLLPLSGERQPRPWLATQYSENWAKVSPDGHWLAYASNESGRFEIYVQSFPEPGRKVTVSKGGGSFPRWRRDGRELYFVAADDKLMAAPVSTGPNFSAGAPVPLFDVGSYGRRQNRYVYDVSADGQQVLLLRPLEDATTRPLTVVQNWTELLKK